MEDLYISEFQREYFQQLLEYTRYLGKRKDLRTKEKEAAFGSSPVMLPRARRSSKKVDYSEKLEKVEKSITSSRKKLRKISSEASKAGQPIGLECIVKEHKLSELEWGIMALLIIQDFHPSRFRRDLCWGAGILEWLLDDMVDVFFQRSVFYKNSKLRKEGLIKQVHKYKTVLYAEYNLTEKTVQRILGQTLYDDADAEDESSGDGAISLSNKLKGNNLINLKTPRIKLDDVFLPEKVIMELKTWIHQIGGSSDLVKKWGMEKVLDGSKAQTLLLFGPPGTGKTYTAEAIAGTLNKTLLVARYEQIINMWYGGSEKNLVQIFEDAKKEDGILLFDECENLLSRRLQKTQNTGITENRLRNIFLQELEVCEVPVIFTSNFVESIDEAFERRLTLRLEIPVPEIEEREQIWRSFFSKKTPLGKNVDFLRLAEQYKLSGGYIKNAVARALRHCMANNTKSISHAMLSEAAHEEMKSMWTTDNGHRDIGFLQN